MKTTKPGQRPIKATPILVLCSRQDQRVLDTLRRQFKSDARIKILDPHEGVAGSEWEKNRDAAIKMAACIVFLLSSDFFGSDTTYEESLMMLSRRKDLVLKGLVLNLVVRPVAWQDSPFGKLPVLLNGKHARNENEILRAVNAIKEVLRENSLL